MISSTGQAETLFLKNIAFECKEEDLKAEFPGAIDIRMAKRDDGRLKG